MLLHKLLFILPLAIGLGTSAVSAATLAQGPMARTGHAMLEPDTGVLHCAGQSAGDFTAYASLFGESAKPTATMHYFGFRGWGIDAKGWGESVRSQLNEHPNTFLAVQVGLSMTADGDPSKHYEAEVASGALDKDLDAFLDALASLARPVYLRIGYEFNGTAWNGYEAESYKAAFVHIADKVRARKMEVALVWNAASGGVANFMDFYPGDDKVDWWGINWFHPPQLGNALSKDFLAKAKEHGKPVMIGEASAAGLGTLKGQARWDKWFKPYFQIIKDNPHIKMMTYINTNWAGYPDFPQWASWGDARLQRDTLVTRLYREEMASSRYLHGADESTSRARLYNAEATAPAAVTGLAADASKPGRITWTAVPEVAAYLIEKDGILVGRSATPAFEDVTLKTGENGKYRVRAISWSGKMGAASAEVDLQMPNRVERLLNGNFATDSSGWNMLQYNGATGTFSTMADGNGGRFVRLVPTKVTGTNWHLQFSQNIHLSKGMRYTVSFRARSAVPTTTEALLIQQVDPYAVYGDLKVDLTSEWKTYTLEIVAPVDVEARLGFQLGVTALTNVDMDDISMMESVAGTSVASKRSGSAGPMGVRLASLPGAVSILRGASSGRVEVSIHRLDGSIQARGVLDTGAGEVRIALPVGTYLVHSRSSEGMHSAGVTVLP
jgi:hypothetical protein